MFDPAAFAFSASTGAAVPLQVCSAAEYILRGENGVVSWVTPAVAGPDGIRLDYIAMALDRDISGLMRLRARGELQHAEGVIEAGVGAEGSKRLSVTHLHFTKPDALVPIPQVFTLVVTDEVFEARWESEIRIGP